MRDRTDRPPQNNSPPKAAPTGKGNAESWTFLSNHSHVLVVLSQDPTISLREVALLVGITERSVQRIVTDLEEAKYLTKSRVGRNNRYSINRELGLRHELERHCDVGTLLEVLSRPD
jgi:DNA-binding transcriptional ArsR family regulator